MDINIAAASNLNYWQQEQKARSDYDLQAANGTFGQILAKAKQAVVSETGDSAGTVTLTKTLADGSLVLLKMQGNRVISEARLDGSTVLQQQLAGMAAAQMSI
ncbi:MAG: hypothetical protein IIZ16_11010 [Selenomonas sp.]|jgi:hypothetical protein|uniref:hypothetical protein n=1 Tax=Selenomonas sp. AE3005 TaxID=1485543 RepID=UPI000488675E|nr:hypothetical protein [Selenomonas sp. AE3005]MBQ1462538.1 hypothetical protein [Selenomonas sp.]